MDIESFAVWSKSVDPRDVKLSLKLHTFGEVVAHYRELYLTTVYIESGENDNEVKIAERELKTSELEAFVKSAIERTV